MIPGQALVTAGVAGEVPCAEAYPVLAGLTGWGELPGGGIRLVGAEGATLGEFSPADRMFEAVFDADGKTYGLTPEAVWNNPQ